MVPDGPAQRGNSTDGVQLLKDFSPIAILLQKAGTPTEEHAVSIVIGPPIRKSHLIA